LVAAVVGDALNYAIGKYFGEKIANSRWVKRQHLEKTEAFYAKHGGKTIVLARFVPIVRTFAPFVAGIGHMPYRQFAIYNIFGGIFWIYSLLIAGKIFGNLPIVKQNFHLVIVAIIVISFLPVAIEWWKIKRQTKQ
jgi:membrane-associated protein